MIRPKSIAVGVSGTGSNLRALHAAAGRGIFPGAITLVFADRPCPAIDWARERGIATMVVEPTAFPDRAAWDRQLAGVLRQASIDLVVLAGFMRVLGRETLATYPGRILNVHPSLLPAFPGTDAISDALAAGVTVTGVTVHLVDETLDGGPILAQEAVGVEEGDDRGSLAARIHAVEHRLLPRCVALAAAGAIRVEGHAVTVDAHIAASLPRGHRALLSVSDKRGLAGLGRGLVERGFELVSTGGTARALRAAGLEVTDVASVTGFPEMLDGRVKTLHPRIAAGVLADVRSDEHRAQLSATAIDPFDVVVVNLYPFEAAAGRDGITPDELIEEIDIGGPTLVRAAAKNHANVVIVTDPRDYETLLAALDGEGSVPLAVRADLAVRAFRHTAAYDAYIAETLPRFLQGGADEQDQDRFPLRLDLAPRRAALLRYGENPHQQAALYVRPGAADGSGPFAQGAAPLQGKELSYNNILDASAAAMLARDLRGPAVAIVKHTNPCGVAEAADLVTAWELALAGDPVSAFGGVVAVHGPVDAPLAEHLVAIFLEVVVAERFEDEALRVLATKPNLRIVEDHGIVMPAAPAVEYRSAGGALLATDADRPGPEDEPAAWTVVSQRPPTPGELADLWLAWRVVRHVTSNAIVLARQGSIVGVGSGQMSRVDSARHATEKAGERSTGAVCASDAFFPFPDGVERCLEAGVSALVQPGGSQRDADVVAAVDRAGASMLMTGRRHFRH